MGHNTKALVVGNVYSINRLANTMWGDWGLNSKEFKGNYEWLKNVNKMIKDGGFLEIPNAGLLLSKTADSQFKVIAINGGK